MLIQLSKIEVTERKIMTSWSYFTLRDVIFPHIISNNFVSCSWEDIGYPRPSNTTQTPCLIFVFKWLMINKMMAFNLCLVSSVSTNTIVNRFPLLCDPISSHWPNFKPNRYRSHFDSWANWSSNIRKWKWKVKPDKKSPIRITYLTKDVLASVNFQWREITNLNKLNVQILKTTWTVVQDGFFALLSPKFVTTPEC